CMIDMKEMAHGTLFAVPLPDGSFLCGRVMLDIRGCLKRHLFPATSPLPGLGKAHLIEMYSAVTPVPEYVPSPLLLPRPFIAPSPLLVPGAFIESWEVGRSWPIIGHMPVDPKSVEFPESLIGFSHPGGGVAFECGEISIPLPLSYYDLMDRIAIFMGRHSAFLWPYTCLRAMGREKEVPVEYKTATLTDNDLRLSPHREEVYQYLPFAMADSYFQKQAQLGLHLERLYEYREEAEERRGSPA